DIAAAVLVRYSAPDVRAELDMADVAHANRRAVVAGSEHDVRDVIDTLQVAEPAHHVLASTQLEHTRANVVVCHADRVRHLLHGQAIAVQTLRIDLHLVLLHVATDSGDLTHAIHAL